MSKILDIGCGWRKVEGAVSIDIRSQTNPTICCDADVDGKVIRFFPFQDNVFDEVYILQTIDHFKNIVQIMKEVQRVAKGGAKLVITVAHVSSLYSWSDPVHQLHLTSRSFLCFTDHPRYGGAYTEKLLRERSFRFIFSKSVISIVPRFICLFSPRIYEKHFSWIFPANDMYFEFEILK